METTTLTTDLIVDETIDGQPAGAVGRDETPRKSSGKKKSAVGKADGYIWSIYLILLLVSCIEVYSASSTRIQVGQNVYMPLIEHAKFLVAGFLIVLGIQRVHYKWFKKYAFFLLLISFIALIYSTWWGENINDAKRAISLGIMTIQPPEILKLTMVLYLSKVLATNQRPGGVNNRGIIICSVTVIIASGILWINGLTNALMVMSVSIALFLIGGIEYKKFWLIIACYVACGAMLGMMKYSGDDNSSRDGSRAETHISRFDLFWKGVSPDKPITDENRQVAYSYMAQAHGGLNGEGIGSSRESSRLPLAYSDYIYSIIVEETGFIGGIALLLLYLCLLARAGRVASKCHRAFPALLIMGCATMIVLQALVHMIIVVGIGPVSGQPLPIISKGGTSIIVMSTAIGMMLSVSRFAVTSNNKKEIKAELNELPEDLHTDNPTMIEK